MLTAVKAPKQAWKLLLESPQSFPAKTLEQTAIILHAAWLKHMELSAA
jgi:hypothetical protein